MKYLDREAAPFDARVWELIDQTVVEVARRHLVGRRFIDVEGPYGLGLKTVDSGAELQLTSEDGAPDLIYSRVTPLPAISLQFQLSLRNMQAFEQFTQPLNLSPAAEAARSCARVEDQLVFYGQTEIGLPGIMTAEGSHHVAIGDWSKSNRAFSDITQAIETLGQSGFSGPYALALTPSLYHQLYRPYEESDLMPIKQIARLVTSGIFKSPTLKDGGVLVTIGREFLKLVLGQDLAVGFEGREGLFVTFNLSESFLLQILSPEAICVLDQVPSKSRR